MASTFELVAFDRTSITKGMRMLLTSCYWKIKANPRVREK